MPLRLLRPALLVLGLLLCVPATAFGQALDTTLFRALRARAIGPAGMSGRVTSIDAVHRDPDIIYAGTASGGLWKSTSGGAAWTPIFDDQPVASIGAVAVHQQQPDVVWVGTGEGNPRNSQSSGDGVFKSLDGGRTWQRAGLEGSRNIHRLLLHPTNPRVAYAGVQGAAWGRHPERGVFKTTDGGATWEQLLYVNDHTGVGDLVMDPSNPDKLLAALWQFERKPWTFTSGGPGSGLYLTYDGGATWQELTEEDGLPAGDLGRIGLAIAPSRPNVVYALVEAKKNALYRSDDGGASWKKVSDENIGNRPFYYADLYVDPTNENRLYNLYSVVTVSEDGGKTFDTLVQYNDVHPDHHAWWIDPNDPDFILDGNDGGLYISRDRGRTWRMAENLPLAQFYHINVDDSVPYNVLGGMQDNGSWRGPAYVWRRGGIRNAYWEEVAFGDGFDVVPDSSSDRYVYAMSQGGNLRRSDLLTGDQVNIRPTHPEGEALRFNWNAALAHDPFHLTTIYYGSQYVHRSTDRGASWDLISPDLTTDDPDKQRQLDSGGLTYDVTQAENFTTITAIAPSLLERGVLWVGSDDGRVHLTRDAGASWTDLTARFRGVPAGTWVPQIRASKHDPAEAFVVFDNHRRNDWTPYVYRTRDYGRTWQRLAEGVWGYALALEQDPVAPGLLFLGTEFGLHVSVDDGATWTRWTHGFPTVSAMDLAIHPREHDLVIGTFGRGAYVLDDIRPLRALALRGTDLLAAPLTAFEAPDAYLAAYAQAAGTRFVGHAHFAGENRPAGAMLTYAVGAAGEEEQQEQQADTDAEQANEAKEAATEAAEDEETPTKKSPGKKVKIEIVDAGGTVLRTFEGPAEHGLHRVVWRLDRAGVRYPSQAKPKKDAPERGGAAVLPGTYTARFTHGDHTAETTVRVHPDPRLDVAPEALAAADAARRRVEQRVMLATEAMDRLRDARETVKLALGHLRDRDDEAAEALRKEGRAVQDSLKALTELFEGKDVQGIRRDPNTLNARLGAAGSYLDAPLTPAHQQVFAQMETRLTEVLAEVNAFFGETWPRFRATAEAAELRLFELYAPLEVTEGE